MKKQFFLLFFILIVACQKQLEINLPAFEQKPVVNCLFTSNDNLQLHLSMTGNIGDSILSPITDAKCYLYSDNICIDSLNYIFDGFYKSTIIPKENKKYSFRLILKDGQELKASTIVPAAAENCLEKIEQKDFDLPDNSDVFDGDIKLPLNRFSIVISDNPNEKNYYEIKIWLKQGFSDSLEYNNYLSNALLYSYDKIIINEDILDYQPYIIVFSDSLFNGQTKQINILYKPLWLSSLGDNEGLSYTYGNYRLIYKFRTISREMYLYRKSLIKHVSNQQTSDIQHLGDPVQLFSNIQNGYGIFAAYNEICDTLKIEASYFRF